MVEIRRSCRRLPRQTWATPEAPCGWPIIDLTELIGPSRALLPKHNFVASVSVLSVQDRGGPMESDVAYFVLGHARVFNCLCHGAGGLLCRGIEEHV